MIAAALATLLLSAPISGTPQRPATLSCLELTDAQLRDRIDALLRSIDVPIAPDEWRALGPRASGVLEAIARDSEALPTRRAQALWGLVHIASPSASAVLSRVAAREDEPFAVRHAAVRGLGVVSSSEELLALLRPVLEKARDARLRAAAAEQLAHRAGGTACGVVRARSAVEPASAQPLFTPAIEACSTR